MADLIDYYGTECPHCKLLEPKLKKLEKELKVKIERKEVWHNPTNQQEMLKLNPGGGVPFLWNKKTKKAVLGNVDYGELKSWAQGK